jgi:hypothetical protein
MKKELSTRHLVVVTMNLRLLQFLIKKKALRAFLDNCERRMYCWARVVIDRMYIEHRKEISNWDLSDYFSWSLSKEGIEYWSKLHREFELLYY